jgi:hypothetical protein
VRGRADAELPGGSLPANTSTRISTRRRHGPGRVVAVATDCGHDEVTFDWDETKRLLNLQKHGIGFLDAQVLFHDERAYTYRSPRPGEAGGVTVGSVEARLIGRCGAADIGEEGAS